MFTRTLNLQTLSVRICNTTSYSACFRSATFGRSSRAVHSWESTTTPSTTTTTSYTNKNPNLQIFYFNHTSKNYISLILYGQYLIKIAEFRHFAFISFTVFTESRWMASATTKKNQRYLSRQDFSGWSLRLQNRTRSYNVIVTWHPVRCVATRVTVTSIWQWRRWVGSW